MTITVADFRLFQSERMTDEDDGGGKMTGREIVYGASNSIFDNTSDVDFAVGDDSIRKVYAAVTSASADKFLDAGVVIFKEPQNPNVSVLMTSTGSHYDERLAIQEQIENYLVQGTLFPMALFGVQVQGSRAISFYGREEAEPPAINSSLVLVEYTDAQQNTVQAIQYVRVTRILTNAVQSFTTSEGDFKRRVVQLELTEALQTTFHGSVISKYDNIKPQAVAYTTVVADAARYYGIRPLIAEASPLDVVVNVDQIYSRIVPTSEVDTPMTDLDVAARRSFPVPAGSTLSFTTGITLGANSNLYIGQALVRGSLTITLGTTTLKDQAGQLKDGLTSVATINTALGVVTFLSSSPNYVGSKTVSFQPAGLLTRENNSFGIPVKDTNRFRAYVASLNPPPAPGTLIVDYLSLGNWYRLTDGGDGILTGASQNYGAGTVDFDTGSVAVTLGALPDLNSMILFFWGSGISTERVTGTTPLHLELPFALEGVRTNGSSTTLHWGGITLTDDGHGHLVGTGGEGRLTPSGCWLVPTALPAKGTEFTLNYDAYSLKSSAKTTTFTSAVDAGSQVSLTLDTSDGPLIPGSVSLTFTIQATVPY